MDQTNLKKREIREFIELKSVTKVPPTQTARPGFQFPKSNNNSQKKK